MKRLFIVAALLLGLPAFAQTVNNHCGAVASSTQATAAVTVNSSGGSTGCGVTSGTGSITSGDLLLCSCGGDSGATVNSCADTLNGGQTWSSPSGANITGTSGAGNAKIFAAVANASGTDVVTCTLSTTSHDPHIDFRDVRPPAAASWVSVASAFDQKGTAQTSTSPSSVSTSSSTGQAVEYVAVFIQDSPASRTITVGTGYGNLSASPNSGGGDSAAGEDKNVSSTGTQSGGFGGTSTDVVVSIITTWKATSSSTVTCTMGLMGAGPC